MAVPLILALGRQRQVDASEFKASLVQILSWKKTKQKTERDI